MTSAKRIASAYTSTNLRSDEQHSDIDVVASMAWASELGSALHRLVGTNTGLTYRSAVRCLSLLLPRVARRRRIGIGRSELAIVAEQSIHEWLVRVCPGCSGTGEALLNYSGESESGPCDQCGGTGLYVPRWDYRASRMGVPKAEGHWWEKRIDLGKEIAEDSYRYAQSKVSINLKSE